VIGSRTLTACVLTAAALLCVACGDDAGPEKAQRTVTTPIPTVTPADSVVFVRARYEDRTTAGTGFVYDARAGLILTSDHAIEASSAVTVTTADGRTLHGRALARAQCHDFAVVKLHPIPDDLIALTFADSDLVKTGQTVTSIAYNAPPADTERPTAAQISYGRPTEVGVSAVLHDLLPSMRPLIAHETPLTQAASGSPLLNEHGQVVGLNTLVGYPHGEGSRPDQQYAMASNEIYRLLRQLSAGPESSLSGWRDEHRCHRAMASIAGIPYQRSKSHADMEHEAMPAHEKDDEEGHDMPSTTPEEPMDDAMG
jgi:S1-C subfamily serine protease